MPIPPTTVTIIGAGIAGLAAACALANTGHQVQLLERRPYVGGRASSYPHPGANETIDNCQHILLGCCTNLIDLYGRLGVENQISWSNNFTYIEPGGRRTTLAPSPLPAPLHTLPAFLRAAAFSLADKLAIARALSHFLLRIPADTEESFAAWAHRHHQTPGAIDRFWKPILASALNEDLDRISIHYAGKVIRDSFLSSPEAGRMGIPQIPLTELYSHAIRYIEARGGQVHLRTSVDALTPNETGWHLHTAGSSFTSELVILALPFEALQKLLPALPENPAATTLAATLAVHKHSPITAIHLWFDREITELPHAVLLDSPFEWLYQVSKLQPARQAQQGSYIELIVSASNSLVPMPRQQIIDLALTELPRFFPKVPEATLLKAAVTKEVRATFSVPPLIDRLRPTPASPWPGIFLAGDWTRTGWPATMEGAVRSGYLAAQAIAPAHSFLVPDLPATGLMRLLG
jgi:squalene-associated FAD-dependent desaturase